MNWKRRIDLFATILAALIAMLGVSRAFAGRLVVDKPSGAKLSGASELMSSVLEWRVSRNYTWNRKMRSIGVLYEHQVTTELLPYHVLPISVPSNVAGQFGSGDWLVKDSYADIYQFDGQKGDRVTLDASTVRAWEVDTYVALLDPYLRPHAENDDYGSINSDSRLETTLNQGGVWTVVVLSLEPTDGGEYTLTVSRPDVM